MNKDEEKQIQLIFKKNEIVVQKEVSLGTFGVDLVTKHVPYNKIKNLDVNMFLLNITPKLTKDGKIESITLSLSKKSPIDKHIEKVKEQALVLARSKKDDIEGMTFVNAIPSLRFTGKITKIYKTEQSYWIASTQRRKLIPISKEKAEQIWEIICRCIKPNESLKYSELQDKLSKFDVKPSSFWLAFTIFRALGLFTCVRKNRQTTVTRTSKKWENVKNWEVL